MGTIILLISTHLIVGFLGCLVGLLWCWVIAVKTLHSKRLPTKNWYSDEARAAHHGLTGE